HRSRTPLIVGAASAAKRGNEGAHEAPLFVSACRADGGLHPRYGTVGGALAATRFRIVVSTSLPQNQSSSLHPQFTLEGLRRRHVGLPGLLVGQQQAAFTRFTGGKAPGGYAARAYQSGVFRVAVDLRAEALQHLRGIVTEF